jgi:transposase
MTTIEPLVPEQLCGQSSRCHRHRRAATAADPASTTAPRWLASSTNCTPASLGGCCPPTSVESSQRLGRHRHVVERSLAWLVGQRRLQVRYERRADILLGFLSLACALICLKPLNRS